MNFGKVERTFRSFKEKQKNVKLLEVQILGRKMWELLIGYYMFHSIKVYLQW